MTRLERWLIAALLILGAGLLNATRAQNPLVTPYYTLVPTAALYSTSSCPTPPSGYFAYCQTGAGEYTITSAGVVTPPVTPSPTVSLTLNGTTKTLPASFTIASTQANPAVTAQ